MPSIDLNCDLGESFGAYTIGMDAEILPYVTSANIACGFHAGDPSVMQKSVLLCKKYGVQVGAHPGLPDLQGFGRRRMAIFPAEAEADVMYQIGALKAFCDAAGVPLHHVKPHGALYNMAARDPVLAAAICRAVQAAAPGAVLLALSGSEMVKAAQAISLPVANEVFADRGYRPDGSLVPRGTPGAMIEDEDEAIARVIRMVKEQKVTTITGKDISIQVEMDDDIVVNHDSKWTVEALTNILENAVKYSPEHTTITVRTQELASNVLIEVEDEGMGIPAEELHKIYQRFYRGRKAKEQVKDGAGVGLYLARKIIEEQGGTIAAKRKAEKGMIFKVTLPLIIGE